MPRKKDVVDLPMITAREAAQIFGCSYPKFRLKFAEVLQHEITMVNGKNGALYLLTDVLRSAFPEASDHTIHIMALECNFRSGDRRVAKEKDRRAIRKGKG